VNEQPQSGGSSQRSTPNGDNAPCKLGREVCDFFFLCFNLNRCEVKQNCEISGSRSCKYEVDRQPFGIKRHVVLLK
jgi:hypothetical protein